MYVEGGTNLLEYGGGEPALSDGTGLTAGLGYQLSPYLYLGVSTGLQLYSNYVVPTMVDLRYYVLDKKNTPFVGFRFGQCLDWDNTIDFRIHNAGVITIPQVGYAFGHLTVSAWACRRLYLSYDSTLHSTFNIVFGVGWEF
ncbi:MAG: hypothetical protein SOZ00_07455 [Tidjanibacter sp.]|nr:hypothetical protein [Tidjanibacter sp.]